MAKLIRDKRLHKGTLPGALLEDSGLSPLARLAWGVLDSFGDTIKAGQKAIAQRMGFSTSSVKSVRTYLRELKAGGWLNYHGDGSDGEPNEYFLTMPPSAWAAPDQPRVGSANPTLQGSTNPTPRDGQPYPGGRVNEPHKKDLKVLKDLKDSPPSAAPSASPNKITHQLAINIFCDRRLAFRKFNGIKYRPTGRDVSALKKLLQGPACTQEEWLAAVNFYLSLAEWKENNCGHAMHLLCDELNAYLRPAPAKKTAQPAAVTSTEDLDEIHREAMASMGVSEEQIRAAHDQVRQRGGSHA